MRYPAETSADTEVGVEPRSYVSLILIMLLLELGAVTYMKSMPVMAVSLVMLSVAVGVLLLVADSTRTPSGAAAMYGLLGEIERRRAAGEKFDFAYGRSERSLQRQT